MCGRTGLSAMRIRRGRREFLAGRCGRIGRPGAGRKRHVDADPRVLLDLERLVDADSCGDQESPLRWTSRSRRKLADGLLELSHAICARLVAPLLVTLGFSLHANREVRERSRHPDRDAQFRYINQTVKAQIAAGQPAMSLDTRKKELVGDFKNGGREWRRKCHPEPVRLHDFKDKQLGKAIP